MSVPVPPKTDFQKAAILITTFLKVGEPTLSFKKVGISISTRLGAKGIKKGRYVNHLVLELGIGPRPINPIPIE